MFVLIAVLPVPILRAAMLLDVMTLSLSEGGLLLWGIDINACTGSWERGDSIMTRYEKASHKSFASEGGPVSTTCW